MYVYLQKFALSLSMRKGSDNDIYRIVDKIMLSKGDYSESSYEKGALVIIRFMKMIK